MMGLLKFIIAVVALMVLATIAFGQTPDAGNPASGWSTFALEEELIMPLMEQTEASEPLPDAQPAAEPAPVSIPVNQMRRVDAEQPLRTEPTPVSQQQLQQIQPIVQESAPADTPAQADAPLQDQLFNQFMGEPPVTTAPEPVPTPVPASPQAPAPQELTGAEATPLFNQQQQADGTAALQAVNNSALNDELWQDSKADNVKVALQRVRENRLHSPEGRLLLQRLLLTEGDAPEGMNSLEWRAERAHTLQVLGMAQAAGTLLADLSISQVVQDKLLSRSWVENALLTGNDQPACDFVREHILNNSRPFWRKALLVCQALSGNADAFRLSWKLVEQQEKETDPAFYGLMQALLDGSAAPELEEGVRVTPLRAMLYALSPRLLKKEMIAQLPDMVLRSLIMREDIDLTLRLAAAERLANETGNTVDVDNLALLYQSLQFDIAFGEDPLQLAADAEDGGIARALLWQVAGGAALPSARAVGLQALWMRAKEDGLTQLPSFLLPDLRGIQPTPTLAWFAPFVVRTALHAGEIDIAREWWKVLQQNRSLTEDIAAQRTDLALSFALLEGEVSKKAVEEWWKQRSFNSPTEQAEVQRSLAVLESSGMTIPTAVWEDLHKKFSNAHGQQGVGPGPLWLRLVAESLENQRTGEAVLVLLEPLMYVAPAQMAPQGIANVVSGLRFLGLTEEAQVLALEAMLPDQTAAQ